MSVPRFGLGLLELGRTWGFRPSEVPDEVAALEFLRGAFELGARVFDTAPSYAYSEQRLGLFLKELTPEQRATVTVATKFGETWDFAHGKPVTAHDYDSLMVSLENSFRLLGRIDVLQVHKSTPAVLRSGEVRCALDDARVMGVSVLGASLKDLESAVIACTEHPFAQMQFPFNAEDRSMLPAMEEARATGRQVYVNRPFGEGRLLHAGASVQACIEAVVSEEFEGAVLFGTRSLEHLKENLAAFEAVCAAVRPIAG
jgi:aryl-alcohol dehydrogenase-like predicted oxidoreductase